MKRILSCLLCCLLLLTGCTGVKGNEVTFYYCREPESTHYFSGTGVIQPETRDLTGHQEDLRYMVGLYLAGPMAEDLSLPFTKATKLLSVEQTDSQVTIELSSHNKLLSDSEFSLGCACLALTCLDFTECHTVTIVCADRSITMDADSILLFDTLPQQETTGG